MVVNHDGLAHLGPCLESLLGEAPSGGLEVVLVDNGSRDGSQAWVRSRFPDVRLLEAGRNLGFAAGNNLGILRARGEHVVLLNNDTRVRPGWLEALLGAVGPGVGAVTSKLLYADRPGVIQNAGGLLLEDGGGADRGAGEPDAGQFGEREEVFGFCGAAALLTRAMLGDAGRFDPAFFMYYEDLDLSWRMRLRGWSVLYEPAAQVEHVHAASSVEGSPFFHFHADRNRLFTLVKNASAGTAARCLGAVLRRRGESSSAEPGAGTRPLARVGASFALHLPRMLAQRARIRGGRRVADATLEAMMVPRERWLGRSA